MLPVADMGTEVQEWDRKDRGSGVEGVKVEVEDIYAVVALGIDDDGSIGAGCDAIIAWCCTLKPCWVAGYVVV